MAIISPAPVSITPAIRAVCEDMASARMKNRIVFYYLLTKKLGRESAFV